MPQIKSVEFFVTSFNIFFIFQIEYVYTNNTESKQKLSFYS